MLAQILPFRRHLGVEFERVPVKIGVDLVPQLLQGLAQLLEADDAPGTDHV
jgi:hypothetical protein